MQRLTILYDEQCPICVRCRDWLAVQPAFVALDFLGCRTDEAAARYGAVPWLREELVVVSDEGDVWAGPAAFLVSLWALQDWREWSYRLSGPLFAPLAQRFFESISKNRKDLARRLFPGDDCTSGTCHARRRRPLAYR
jgi:predicted DCC family thiol-disulfide oxidoreductase YuxK